MISLAFFVTQKHFCVADELPKLFEKQWFPQASNIAV